MDTLKDPCRLPLITGVAGEKDYYRLDSHGRLQHWKFVEEGWMMPEADLFQQTLDGFDGALDGKGLFHLLAYNHRGTIYHLDPLSAGSGPQSIHTASQQKINRLSCCFNPLNQLQILYLSSADHEKQRQQLYYLNSSDEGSPALFVDYVGAGASYCSILSDRLNRSYLVYPVLDGENSRIAFRCMETAGGRPGRIYLLPGRQGSAGPPSFYRDLQNNIYLAWISRSAGKAYLNYIRREKTGDWRHFMQLEVPPQTLPATILSCTAKELLIFFQWGSRLTMLYSRDGGTSWHRGRDREIEQESVLARLRIGCTAWEKSEQSGIFLISFSVPPETLTHGRAHHDYGIEANQATRYSGELNSMAIISAAVFEQIRRLELDNSRLQEKLRQKEKELAALGEKEQLSAAELERVRAEKTRQTLEEERLYKEKLQKQQEKREDELKILREQLTLLRSDIIKLQNRKGQLIRENSELSRRLTSYEEREKASLLFKQDVKKDHYFSRILQRIKTAGNG